MAHITGAQYAIAHVYIKPISFYAGTMVEALHVVLVSALIAKPQLIVLTISMAIFGFSGKPAKTGLLAKSLALEQKLSSAV